MSYKNDFPNFGALNVKLPENFGDTSYRNDLMPCFTREFSDGARLVLWIDYADVSKRENELSKRFAVQLFDENDEREDIEESDDYSVILAAIETTLERFPACAYCDGSGYDAHDEKRPCNHCDGLGR